MYAGLHDEIWLRILQHLGRPIPRANSGAWRGDLMQPDWVTCMAVSSTFNNLTAPLLYRRVATDRLDQLILGIDGPSAHPKISAKRNLLGKIRTLDLEYPDPYQEVPYHQLLQCGNWELVGLGPAVVARTKLLMWLGGYIKQFKQLDRAIKQSPDMFDLDALTYNAYLPVHDREWTHALAFLSRQQGMQEEILRAQNLAGQFVQSSKAKHFCQRSNHGPLRCVQLQAYRKEYKPGKHGAPTLVMHQARSNNRIFGSALHIRWIYEQPATGWSEPVDEAVEDALGDILVIPLLADHLANSLSHSWKEADRKQGMKLLEDAPRMDFYVNHPAQPVDHGQSEVAELRCQHIDRQRNSLAEKERTMHRLLKAQHAAVCASMEISLRVIEDAPRCEACGA